jgi:hypothetical protein
MSAGDLVFTVIREPSIRPATGEAYTLGRMYCNGVFYCFTCEDEDRKLEFGGVKVKTRTAIPRGRYHLTASFSNRFQKELPYVEEVPQFEGVRMHGGNRAEDSEGCLLLGQVRTSTGVAKCADTVAEVTRRINEAEDEGRLVILEVK